MTFIHHHALDRRPQPDDFCFVIEGERIMARIEEPDGVELPWFDLVAGWVDAKLLHVGLLEGQPCWLCAVESAEAVPPSGWQWHDTRAVLGALAPAEWQALSCARQLMWWERRHRFCGACGAPTIDVAEERARRCPRCHALYFPVASPAIIVAVTRGDELLLAHNRNFRPGMFSLLAGFVDPGETLEQAVVREVGEEVGVEIDQVRYVASQPWSFPNSLMVGFDARYLRGEIKVDGKEIEHAGWYKRGALPDVPRVGTVARSLIDRWVGS
jgi:NAD+ diphosphatase